MLKSIFVSTYLLILHGALAYAVYLGISQGFGLTAIGLIIATLPGVLVFDILLAFKPVARTRHHLIFISIISSLGLVIIFYEVIRQAFINPIALGLGLLSVIGWYMYDYWFSVFESRQSKLLEKGQTFPKIQLQTPDGDKVDSNQYLGTPNVFLFYRGNWCPLCMAQIQEIAGLYQSIAATGANIILISPQSHKNTQKLAAKFEVPFIFLVDKNNHAAKQLNICAENGLPLGMQIFGYDSDTVMPTLVVTDSQGKIIFADLTDNYRVRPEPQTIIDILAANTA